MRRLLSGEPWLPILAAAASLTGCGGGGGSNPPLPVSTKIQHVVIIFQENRTPDNLFHGLPNADIANAGMDSTGQTIPLTPIPLANDYDIGHTHPAFKKMYDGGKMDGADRVNVNCKSGASNCPPPNPQFRYVNPADVTQYFQLAERYAFADRMFQTNQGPSFPAHQYIISGTSEPAVGSALLVSENTIDSSTQQVTYAGCDAPSTAVAHLIDQSGSENHTQYPCYEHPTLMDLLDQAMVSWKYYAPDGRSIWTGPNAIAHLRNGPDWNNVIIPQSKVLTDIGNGQLAQVTWVIPDGQESDHAAANDGSGPSWVASIVNAIGSSAFWSSTAIFITWDDWGGWYDHVPPPSIYNQYEYGFRVPLIVVSPYARPAYVSHVTHDFGSILKFVEEAFSLPSLGYADARADDLLDCFDFNQTPLAYQTIATTMTPADFAAQQEPPYAGRLDPDDD